MFIDLPKYEVLMKVAVDGQARFWQAKTMRPLAFHYGQRENLIRRSREKYATPRHVVEAKIFRWMRYR